MEKNRDKPNDTPSQEDLLLSGYKGLVVAMKFDRLVPDSEIK